MRQSTSFGFAVALALGMAPKAHAQVAADIRIGTGPVSGTIYIGDRPRPRRVVVEHVYPRRIVVEHRRGYGPHKYRGGRRNARVVVVYYDRRCNEYFDRYRRGLQRMRAYEHDGRIYRYDDDRYDDKYDRRGDRYGRYRRDDRDRYDRDRYDRDDRDYDDRDHGSWEHDH